MRARHWLIVAVSLVFLAGVPTPVRADETRGQAPKYRIRWLLGHNNLDYFEEAAAEFKKAVENGSRGEIAVDIAVSSDDPGDSPAAPEIALKVSKGEAEMGHSFADVLGGLDPRFHAFEAPYLFRGHRHAEGIFEGPVGTALLEGLRARGLVGLSFTYSGGASGVAAVEREIRRPEDMKGLKVGVYGNEVDAAWLTSLGAIPVPVEHRLGDVLPLARTGDLDAVVITWRNLDATDSLYRKFRRMNLMGSTYLVSVTYVNEKFFNDLPRAYRALIAKASRDAGRIERAKTIQLNESAKRGLLAKGVRAVHLTQAHKRLFVEALRPAFKTSIERALGRDLVERIRRTRDDPGYPSIPGDLLVRR